MLINAYILLFFNHYTAHNTLSAILIKIGRILNISIKKQIIFAKMSDFKVLRAVEDDLNVTEFVDLFNQKVK